MTSPNACAARSRTAPTTRGASGAAGSKPRSRTGGWCSGGSPSSTRRPARSHHHELLLRMELDGEVITPNRFLPHAENCELITRSIAGPSRRGVEFARTRPGGDQPLRQEPRRSALLGDIKRALGDRALAQNVIFEITETAAAENLDAARALVEELTGARLRGRARRLRHRVRVVHLPQAAARHRAEDRHRVRPRPGRRSGRPARGQLDHRGGEELRDADRGGGGRGRGDARAPANARGRTSSRATTSAARLRSPPAAGGHRRWSRERNGAPPPAPPGSGRPCAPSRPRVAANGAG